MATKTNPSFGDSVDGVPSDSGTVAKLDDYGDLSFAELRQKLDSGGLAIISDVDELRKVEKEALIGVEFILTSWAFNDEGSFGAYVRCEVTTATNEKLLFIDGSTGILKQLRQYEDKLGGVTPIYVPKGLRVSNYMYDDPATGKAAPATTYYFNNET